MRQKFSDLTSSIVCESERLTAIGDEVAEACTEERLKMVLISLGPRLTVWPLPNFLA